MERVSTGQSRDFGGRDGTPPAVFPSALCPVCAARRAAETEDGDIGAETDPCRATRYTRYDARWADDAESLPSSYSVGSGLAPRATTITTSYEQVVGRVDRGPT